MLRSSYDVIIVGGGPAGCVLAARLTEDADRTVLLLEAGPDYGLDPAGWPEDVRDPMGLRPDSHPWGYVNRQPAGSPPLPLPRARILGGSSTVNGCIWLRGSRADYDQWEALGNPGWGFDTLLPYFKRAENDPGGTRNLHGQDGPVPVQRVTEREMTPIDHAFVEAALALDIPYVEDANDAPDQRPGVGPTPQNIAAGTRMNAAFTYLAPARSRPNLQVVPDTLVDRVLLEDGRTTAVRAADGRVFAASEVILCCGTYGSPAILMRSGIGAASQLTALGIPVVRDLPGVGEHLLDHPRIPGPALRRAIRPEFAPAQPTFIPVMLKARSSQVEQEIDLHIYSAQSFDVASGQWVHDSTVSLQFARSRGRVRLVSADPHDTLEIDHNYFAELADLEALCDGVELAERLFNCPSLSRMLGEPRPETLRWRDRDELRQLVRTMVGTTFHPSSTCRMGPPDDPTAVVDSQGRVHGVTGLRVVDASIFPTSPRCNLHFPVVAVAERMADLIRAR